MSDADCNADSISDASNAHSDDEDDGSEAIISPAVRELCDQLRANDPRVLRHSSTFVPSKFLRGSSEDECIAVFQALKENTSVKRIKFERLFERHYTERAASLIEEYVESSKTLQRLYLSFGGYLYSNEGHEMISLVLRSLSRNKSVTKLSIDTSSVVKFASVAFEELLTQTQTLQKLEITGSAFEEFDEVQTAAIASGFANNTTLRDVEFQDWPEADLTPVLTALQDHPALQKIHISAGHWDISFDYLPSLSGLDVLLRSQDSKVRELVLHKVDTDTIDFHLVLRELGRNTTVTDLAICESVLSRENLQQLKAVLRQNTVLQHLSLRHSRLRSGGLAEIAPALYRNTSIKTLDLSNNGLVDIESANVLRELLRRNKTITRLSLDWNAFGRNAAAARSIFEGVRNNTTLQTLDLSGCGLDDRSISVLANAMHIRRASMVELNLLNNNITSVGVRALVDDNVEAVKTLTELCLSRNSIGSEGATILANALWRNAMPNLERLHLNSCHLDADGFVALMSTLEQNTNLQSLDLKDNDFGERGFMALAESLPNIKGLHQIDFTVNASFQSTLPLLLEGFRKNTSLVEVNIDIGGCENMEWSQELKFLGQRNRFTPLLKASDPPDASPQLGIWSRALAKVATEPDVLFYVLRNKPKLVGSADDSNKRKRDDE
jgi:Ran GTPase-activating protein (RanGAP) involved in mRNA processing and transport